MQIAKDAGALTKEFTKLLPKRTIVFHGLRTGFCAQHISNGFRLPACILAIPTRKQEQQSADYSELDYYVEHARQ